MTYQEQVTAPGEWPTDGAFRIPSWVYTDPAVFEREMAVLHHGPTWNFVGLECEVPEPGNWKRSSVGLRSVVITRDKQDDIHVVENRCSHRASPICWDTSGKSTGLNCPYHQWRFNLKGDLVGVPFETGLKGAGGMPNGFDKSANGLRKLKVARRGGAVWASFSNDAPSFEDYAGPEMLAALDRITARGKLKLLGTSRQVYKANWKMWIENARDNYHATLLHTFLTAFKLVRADLPPPQVTIRDGHTIGVNFTRPEADEAVTAQASGEMLKLQQDYRLNDVETVDTDRFDYDDGRNIGFQMFPSCMYQPHLNVPSYRQIVPRSVDEHEIHWTFFGFDDDDDDITRRRLKQANMFGPAGYVTAEDGEVLVRSQPAVAASPESEQILEMGLGGDEEQPTLITERAIRAFYTHYRRILDL